MTPRLVLSSLTILLLSAMAGSAAGAASGPAPRTTPNADERPEDYWTPERMRQAKPFPLPKVGEDRKVGAPPADEGGPVISAPSSPPAPPKR
jgi:hypothetical protein